jgi:hypothetical protein
MIVKGSMVVLKGHHLFPMVVARTWINERVENYRKDMADNTATVAWLDSRGVPHSESYPLELLEEVDG